MTCQGQFRNPSAHSLLSISLLTVVKSHVIQDVALQIMMVLTVANRIGEFMKANKVYMGVQESAAIAFGDALQSTLLLDRYFYSRLY